MRLATVFGGMSPILEVLRSFWGLEGGRLCKDEPPPELASGSRRDFCEEPVVLGLVSLASTSGTNQVHALLTC